MGGSTAGGARLPSRAGLRVAVLFSGVSGLSWELLWQHRTALALGVSAWGTAVTLSSMMAGIGLGGLLAARWARRGALARPLRAYGIAELLVAAGALLVPVGLAGLSRLDAALYAASPAWAPGVHVAGMLLLLLAPATAMGATLPILASLAEERRVNVAALYSLNVLGAVLGVLGATFVALPLLGVAGTERLAALGNLGVALWAISRGDRVPAASPPDAATRPAPRALALACASGFTIFALEVSWFRSLRASLQSTTESFALILAAFLTALAIGAALASRLRRRTPSALEVLIPAATLAVLCATPLVDALDRWLLPAFEAGFTPTHFTPAAALLRFAALFAAVGLPAVLLGTVFPWLLADHESTQGVGRLTAVNTAGAVAGALLAGFVLLPALGATRTSWIAALVVLGAGAAARPTPRLLGAGAVATLAGLLVATQLGGPAARLRVQGYGTERAFEGVEYVSEGPDSTVWVTRSKRREGLALVIDGFSASDEGAGNEYMRWMGHLPALAAARLEHALVICFGTGQTSDAVRRHAPRSLTVVDVNDAVFRAAPLFRSNHAVLEDARVEPVVMDGRAFLRRAGERRFDVVTLEPMPPNFAGVNHLYSREFYELVRERLARGGVTAQWVPFHLIAPEHMRAIVAAFHEVFPYTRLWITPPHGTGILVGGLEPWTLRRSDVALPPHPTPIARHFALEAPEVAALAEDVEPVTDDNQLLAYGWQRFARAADDGHGWYHTMYQQNMRLLSRFRVHDRARVSAAAAARPTPQARSPWRHP